MLIVLKGQVRGGKNHVMITRTGRRYPSARFSSWLNDALLQIRKQHKAITPINEPVDVAITYIAEDHHRRDIPAIIDALWHLLEKAGVVTDDRFLGGEGCMTFFDFKDVDKNNAGVQIIIGRKNGNSKGKQ